MITIDLCNIPRDEVLAAIRELDREEGARVKCYPGLVAAMRLTAETVEARRLALSTAREIVACVARGMIAECGKATRVLPVLPVESAECGLRNAESTADDTEGEKP